MLKIWGAGAIVLDPINHPGLVLMVREGEDDPKTGKKEGTLSPPTGHFNSDEDTDLRATAIREVCEETGYPIVILRLMAAYDFGKFAGNLYLAEVNGEPELPTAKDVVGAEWLPLASVLLGDHGSLRDYVRRPLEDYYLSIRPGLE